MSNALCFAWRIKNPLHAKYDKNSIPDLDMAAKSRNNIDLLLLDLIHCPSTHSGMQC